DVGARSNESSGTDPIFRPVDCAPCPTDDVSPPRAKTSAYKLLLDKGLIRIGLALPPPPPANLEFSVASVADPYGCTTNPGTGLTSARTGKISMYRPPPASATPGFLCTSTGGGRQSGVGAHAIAAARGHAEGNSPPTADQLKQIVDFETGIFTAQIFDDEAGILFARGATGGPVALSLQLSKFFVGVNDPVGLNPTGMPFDPN